MAGGAMTTQVAAARPGGENRGVVLFAALLALLGSLWPTLQTLPATWQRHGMSHGWLIAALIVWLLWRDRRQFTRAAPGNALVMVPVAALSLLWFAAIVAHVQVAHQLAFVLLLVCWSLVLCGDRAARTAMLLGATFFLALPLWESGIPLLRPLTTLASGNLARLAGVPAVIDGDFIHIMAGSFLVADGCAGINYLVAGLVIGAIYAHVLASGWRAQAVIVAVAGVIAILGNWLRVAALILVGHRTGMESRLIEEHSAFGWGVFAVSLVPFFFAAHFISRRRPGSPADDPQLDGTEGNAGQADTHDQTDRRTGLVVLTTGLAVLGPLLYLAVGLLPPAASSPSAAWPAAGGTWLPAAAAEQPAWQPDYHGADRHERTAFTNGDAWVVTDHYVFLEQDQGAKLVGYPNRIAPPEDVVSERIVGPLDPGGRRWVRQAVLRTPEGPVVTWFWYRVGGVETSIPIQAKTLEIPAFVKRRRTAELLAVSAVCRGGDCRDAVLALASFMEASAMPDRAAADPLER
jgi:exosortase